MTIFGKCIGKHPARESRRRKRLTVCTRNHPLGGIFPMQISVYSKSLNKAGYPPIPLSLRRGLLPVYGAFCLKNCDFAKIRETRPFCSEKKTPKNTREIQFYALEKWLKIVFPLSKFDFFWSILMLHNSQTICAKTRKKNVFVFFPSFFLLALEGPENITPCDFGCPDRELYDIPLFCYFGGRL